MPGEATASLGVTTGVRTTYMERENRRDYLRRRGAKTEKNKTPTPTVLGEGMVAIYA